MNVQNEHFCNTLSDIPEELRPYEKCEEFGPRMLTDPELLAVILKTGTVRKSSVKLAEELLFPDGVKLGFNALIRSSPDDLKKIKGIGRVKAIQLSCLGEICRRMSEEKSGVNISVRDPSSVAAYYMQRLRLLSEEEIHLMTLDTRDRLIRSQMISRGTVNASIISPREVFIAALTAKAASFILVHNHPSGDPEPSENDIEFSRFLFKLGNMMNIPLRDSIVLGDNCYVSLMEKGLIL